MRARAFRFFARPRITVILFSFFVSSSLLFVLPALAKLHALNAFILVAIFPFTRLVHMLSLPLAYLWRPYQLVRWNWPTPKVLGEGE